VADDHLGRSSAIGRSTEYDAFISYSHALDGNLAPRFQRELERFAKPWYQLRAIRVFRDNASLTANPGLWSSIERALTGSRWFVLMASPEAAASPWVGREVNWWLANRSPQRILIVLTAGELFWDEHSGDFDWASTNAVPQALRGALAEEPRWVDLRWLHKVEHIAAANPTFRDSVADVAAAVREVPKDLLVGEHIKAHRRAMRLAWSGVSALALLLVVTLIATFVAIGQRDTAVANARVAEARALAALAVANLGTHLDLAELFAVQAYRTDDDPQTRSALFQAVTASPGLQRYLPAGASVTTVTGSADGNVVLAGTADGHVLRWDIARGTKSVIRIGTAPVTSLSTDDNATTTAAANGTAAVLWQASTSKQTTLRTDSAYAVGVSPSGQSIAVLNKTPNGAELTTYDGVAGDYIGNILLTTEWDSVGLPDDATIMLYTVNGYWERRSATDFSTEASSTNPLHPATTGMMGYSPHGDFVGLDTFGQSSVWHSGTSTGNSDVNSPDLNANTYTGQNATAFAISPDGTRVARTDSGTINVSGTSTGTSSAWNAALTGNNGSNANGLAFLGDLRLVSANGATVTLWDLTQLGRLDTDLDVQLDYGCNACTPDLAVSPKNDRAVFVTNNDATEYHLNGQADPQAIGGTNPTMIGSPTSAVWSNNGADITLIGLGSGTASIWKANSPVNPIGTWPTTAPNAADQETLDVVAAGMSPTGDRVASVHGDGAIDVHAFPSGHVTDTVPPLQGAYPPDVTASISPDLAAAAIITHAGESLWSPVTVVDVADGVRHILPGGLATATAFARNALVVMRPTGTLEVWNTAGTQLLRTIPDSGNYYPGLAVSPDGTLAVRMRSDNTIVLTDLNSGTTIGSFVMPQAPSGQTAFTFTPDGTQLLIGEQGGSLTRWPMTVSGWVNTACTSAGRNLTPAEWTQYVGTTPVPDLTCTR
jgi:hypothetical protein